MERIVIPLHECVTAEQTIVVALPMYRMVSVKWFFNWLRLTMPSRIRRCRGLVAVEGVPLPIAMARLTQTALNAFPGFEWMVVLEDDDIEPPADAFDRVAAYDGFDVVGSLNLMHEPPHRPTVFILGGTAERPVSEHVAPGVLRHWVEVEPGLRPVDAVAMGFTAIRRPVLEEIDPVRLWQPVLPMQGQDMQACWEAGKQGFRVGFDPQMECGHLTAWSIRYKDSEAAKLATSAAVS